MYRVLEYVHIQYLWYAMLFRLIMHINDDTMNIGSQLKFIIYLKICCL
jgi:hypothetical protein